MWYSIYDIVLDGFPQNISDAIFTKLVDLLLLAIYRILLITIDVILQKTDVNQNRLRSRK